MTVVAHLHLAHLAEEGLQPARIVHQALGTLTLRGPAAVWFGVGLDAQNMADSPYTIYVNASGAFEQQIGTCGSEAQHCAGDALAASLTLVANTVVDGVREVVVTRAFAGLTDKHHPMPQEHRFVHLNYFIYKGLHSLETTSAQVTLDFRLEFAIIHKGDSDSRKEVDNNPREQWKIV